MIAAERKAYQADYYRRNRESIRARQNATRNAEASSVRSAMWRSANPERAAAAVEAWHAAHPEARMEAVTRWKKANRQTVALIEARRRARKAGQTVVEFTPAQIIARRAYLGERCWICGSGEDLAWDHVKPLAKGGPHMLSNLRLACTSCNSTKNARWFGVAELQVLVVLVLMRQNINKVNGAAYGAGGIGR